MTTQTGTDHIDGHVAAEASGSSGHLVTIRFSKWLTTLISKSDGVFPVGVSGICPGVDEMATAYLRDDLVMTYSRVLCLRHELRDLVVFADADPEKSQRQRDNRWIGIYRKLFHPTNTYAGKIESDMITLGCDIPVLEKPDQTLDHGSFEEGARGWLDVFLPRMDRLAECQMEYIENSHIDKVDLEEAYAAVADIHGHTMDALRLVFQANSSVSAWKAFYEGIYRRGHRSWSTALRGPLHVIGVDFPKYRDPKTNYWQDSRAWLLAFSQLADQVDARHESDPRLTKTAETVQ